MQTMEWTTIDKSGWPDDGPWHDEPDKIQWQDELTGLPCLIVRGPVGALCGYVGVAEGHPWYGMEFSADGPSDVDVHGGLTFSEKCRPSSEEGRGICHVPAPGEPDHVWWFGFDCAHSGDRMPAVGGFSGHYWTVAEVKRMVANLASQIAAVKDTRPAEGVK